MPIRSRVMPRFADLLSLDCWPLWVGCGLLAVAAVVNHALGRVPNALSLGALGAGFLAALFVGGRAPAPQFGGGIGSSLLCSSLALVLLLGLYRMGLGAGCVKMQMAFAAWVGCGLGWMPAVTITLSATLLGSLLTLAGIWYYSRQWQEQRAAVAVWGRLNEPPAPALFPAQWTLSLGSLAGLALVLVLTAKH